MALSKTIVLLPCHSLEDFPQQLPAADAEALLAAWSGLWHPGLIATTGSIPAWYRADFPPENGAGTLYALPGPSEPLVAAGWVARVTGEGGYVVRKFADRTALLAAARNLLTSAGETQAAEALDAPQLDPDLAADFMALGYAYLMVELLTRQMRYMSNLDELHLEREAVAGAKAALAGDGETARRHLQHCFDVLLDARERFYPADNYLLDLTLLAPTTLGPTLAQELAQSLPINVLLTGTTAEELAGAHGANCDALRRRIDERTAGLVGGEWDETPLPLLSPEAALQGFLRGRQAYHRTLGRWPRVYGRRRWGLSPALPQLLQRLQFDAALHFTLDDGAFPQDRQSKTRWEGIDSTAVDALTRLPVDTGAADTFLRLPQILGETMDLDHVATTTLAHWPGRCSHWYDDLRRITRYAQLLGKFVTVDEYFSHTDSTGRLSRLALDDYRSPYLRQAAAAGEHDPISQFVAARGREARRRAWHALRSWSAALGDESAPAADGNEPVTDADLESAAKSVAARLGRGDERRRGTLLVNTGPLAETWTHPTAAGAGVEVPAYGFAWVEAAASAGVPRGSSTAKKSTVEEFRLRNESLDVLIHPETGGIHAVHAPRVRGNILSQQLAYRLPTPPPQPGEAWRDPQLAAVYSHMSAESVAWDDAAGVPCVVSRGRLVDDADRAWTRFEQRVRLAAGAPRIDVEVTLEEIEPLGADPWTSYVASRLAWNSEDAEMHRGVWLARQPTESRLLEAPDYLDLETDRWRITLLCGGLPYHRRAGDRMLDTLLAVRGETQHTFRFSLGVNLKRPAAAALEIASVHQVVDWPAPPTPSGWLFHLDAPGVVITHWEPLVEEARTTGLRLRVLETEGQPGPARLSAFAPFSGGVQTDFTGEVLTQLRAEDGALRIPLGAHEWAQIEARFGERKP